MNLPKVASHGGTVRLLAVNDAELCAQTFGAPDDPAILLVGGAMAPMDCWEDEFCLLLVAAGRFVIRYDQRDTGDSTRYRLGSPPYGFDDLVADAVGVLDGVGVRRAHLVGMSMGGGIVQRLALEHPARVLSLTLISTSPGMRPASPIDDDLPPMSAALMAQFTDPDSRPQHNHMMLDGGAVFRQRLGDINVATLVIHGVADPLFPLGHAEASAREIPNSRLIPLNGVGHEVPPPWTWDVVVPALVEHTAGAQN